jgi:Holliday junction DNA helicase RuvA
MGLGLTINVASRTSHELPGTGGNARLFTSYQVREDSQSLFGFESVAERDLFEALLKISGIGGKIAIAILDLPRDRIVEAIAAGETEVLQQVQGVGAKTAGRIVLELKDRFAEELMEEWADVIGGPVTGLVYDDSRGTSAGRVFAEAVEALVELGFQRTSVRDLVRKARGSIGEDAPAEDIVRFVLKHAG